MDTHSVRNQPPPLVGYDVFGADAALADGLGREGAGWAATDLSDLGVTAGSEEAIRWGFEANEHPPVLRTHDRFGRRLDRVEYHPSYHRLMEVGVGRGLHAAPWGDPRPGAHVARAAAFYVWSQVDAGHGCPLSMTYAVYPALRAEPELLQSWGPRLTSRSYDPSFAPTAAKRGALAGMGMTEKQGGSDVRANETVATDAGDGTWRLTGHKWFCSAPNSDLWLMLAQAPAGLSCFLVPRWQPDGTPNVVRFQRLKDKLGNRSNASAEVELEQTVALLVGELGRGVPTIAAMVNHTRLDCVIGAAAGMRQAVAQATHHAAHRLAFGRLLTEQPLMRNVLADLAVESEAATLTMLRLAGAYDRGEPEFARLATPVAKYWTCKRHPMVAVEALECLGGNGYVEESIMPRLVRESPLNGIWEGSGNVICLDVLRVMTRSPESVEALLAELDLAAGADRRLDEAVTDLRGELKEMAGLDADLAAGRARRVTEAMAVCLQGSLLVRHSPPAVADAYLAGRLDSGRLAFGTLPDGADWAAVVERSLPVTPEAR